MAPPNIEEMKERESSEHHESQARRNRWRLSRTSTVRLRWATQIVAVGAATVANLVIDGYQSARKAQHSRAEQHSSRTASGFVFWSLLDPFSSPSEPEQSQPHRLPTFIRDPSDVQVAVACFAYSIAMNCFYHIRKGDRYQQIILICGTLSALVVGLASTQDPEYVITGLGRWAVMTSLLLSAAVHRLLPEYGEGERTTLA